MNKILKVVLAAMLLIAIVAIAGCTEKEPPKSDSGVSKITVQVPTGPDGLTTEQRNVRNRILNDNKPGAIKHLYLVSSYSGQVLFYSTVQGKVTSSGKRLTPYTVSDDSDGWSDGIPLKIGDWSGETLEVLEDDGTYGQSMQYLYWWDVKGVYNQIYVSGGQYVFISDQPVAVKEVVINVETSRIPENESQR